MAYGIAATVIDRERQVQTQVQIQTGWAFHRRGRAAGADGSEEARQGKARWMDKDVCHDKTAFSSQGQLKPGVELTLCRLY